MTQKEKTPAEVWQDQGEGDKQIEQVALLNTKRSGRRQRLSAHLHAAGPRPVLEALIAVSVGRNLDEVLEDFARLSAETYHAVGASYFSEPLAIDCGGST